MMRVVEVDTNHYKGNYPDRCALDVIDWPEAKITDLIHSSRWEPLLPATPLDADTRHFFRSDFADSPATHVRLNIYPDGGVSRLRLWGDPYA